MIQISKMLVGLFPLSLLFAAFMRIFISFLFLYFASFSAAAAEEGMRGNIYKMSISELINIKITSVSKKPEKLSHAASAVFVITQEDIRRSGATSIPEALRMTPGIHVARINSNIWAVSARGFNDRFSNKLLVLIDGRSVYNSIFSGVFWHSKDVMLEDVERIEVIRGPGSTLWGANAVNGVINIITKSSKDTEGALLTAGYGNEERGFGSFRYGGKINDDISFRAYAKGFNRDNFNLTTGENANDAWDSVQGGFRIDGDVTETDSFTLQGDIYSGNGGELDKVTVPFPPYTINNNETDLNFSGGNVLGKWKHKFPHTSEIALQLYYDNTNDRYDFYDELRINVNTFDVDFQHGFQLSERQDLTWGLGFRHISDNIHNSSNIVFDPASRETQLFSVFLQDEITLIKDLLKITIGSKFEHNDYTGFEIQPNGRILFTPHEHHTFWAAISRAVRTPNRAEHDLSSFYGTFSTGFPPVLGSGVGSEDYVSEELTAYEVGYRVQPTDRFSMDITAFYNVYDNLWTTEVSGPFPVYSPPSIYLKGPLIFDNKRYGTAHGVELAALWQAFDWWRLQASYSYLSMDIKIDDDSVDTDVTGSPKHLFTLRSFINLPMNLEFDTTVRYADSFSNLGKNFDSYLEMDIHLGWKPAKNLEFSLIGQNLLNRNHSEIYDNLLSLPVVKIGRSVYGKIVWRF